RMASWPIWPVGQYGLFYPRSASIKKARSSRKGVATAGLVFSAKPGPDLALKALRCSGMHDQLGSAVARLLNLFERFDIEMFLADAFDDIAAVRDLQCTMRHDQPDAAATAYLYEPKLIDRLGMQAVIGHVLELPIIRFLP